MPRCRYLQMRLFWQLRYALVCMVVVMVSVLSNGLAMGAVKAALVTNLPQPAVDQMLALAELALVDADGLELLDRQHIARVMREHELALAGLTDATTGLRLGRLLAADLLAVLEGDPQAKAPEAMALVVFDAHSGVRLIDRSLAAPSEASAREIAASVVAAAEKRSSPKDSLRLVSLVGVRNVDVPRNREVALDAIARLVQRRLVAAPQVAVLEREHLTHVSEERKIAPAEAAAALLGAHWTMEIEFRQAAGEAVTAKAVLRDPAGKVRAVEADPDDTARLPLADALATAVARAMDTAVPAASPDPKLDARRALSEADYQGRQRKYRQSARDAEVAVALAPERSDLLQQASEHVFRLASITMRPPTKKQDAFMEQAMAGIEGELITVVDTSPSLTKDPDQLLQGLAYLQRYIELVEQSVVRAPASQAAMRIWRNDHLPLELAGNPFSRINTLFSTLESYRLPEDVKAEVERSRERYHSLIVRRMLPRQLEVLDAALPRPKREGPDIDAILTFPVLIRSLRYSCSDEDRGRLLGGAVGRVKRWIDSQGLTVTPADKNKHQFYTELLFLAFEVKPELSDEMVSPQVPIDAVRTALVPYDRDDRVSLRAFAAGLNLWLDKASGKCSLEETEKSFGTLVDNVDGWLQDGEKAGKLADLDRYATYHVLWRTTGLLYPHPLEVAPATRAVVELMVRRREIMACDVARAMRSLSPFVRMGGRLRPNFPNPENGRSDLALLDRFRQLLDDSGAPLWGGPRQPMLEQTHKSRERILSTFPALAEDSAQFWKSARRVFQTKTHRFAEEFAAQPPVERRYRQPPADRLVCWTRDADNLHYVCVEHDRVESPTTTAFRLLQVRLPGGETSLSEPLVLPVPKAGDRTGIANVEQRTVEYRREYFPVAGLHRSGSALYAACPQWRGLLRFPLDGSPEHLAGDRLGSPVTDLFDFVARSEDGSMLALTDGAPTYVQWFDAGTNRWEVIATSERSEPMTPLDRVAKFVGKMYYDTSRRQFIFCSETPRSLFQFDAATKKLTETPIKFGGQLMGIVESNDEWITVAIGLPPERTDYWQYNVKDGSWRNWLETTGNFDGKRFVVRSRDSDAGKMYSHGTNLRLLDGWLYAGPFRRIRADGQDYQSLPPFTQFLSDAYRTTSQFDAISQHNLFVWSNRQEVWLLEPPASMAP